MTSSPRFAILGPLEVCDATGRHVPLGGRRARELLAVLLLHPNVALSKDRLVDSMWGEAAGDGAGITLRTHVGAVRRVLSAAGAGDRLQTVPGGYVLVVDPGDLDAEAFERLVRRGQEALASGSPAQAADLLGAALALWRGQPLSNLGSSGFTEPAVARLMEMRLVAEEAAIDAALELGRHQEVVGRLQQLVTEHPFRERLCGQFMIALYRSARQVEALTVYAGLRRRLNEGLGLDPSPLLRDLQAAILRQAPALLPAVLPAASDPQGGPRRLRGARDASDARRPSQRGRASGSGHVPRARFAPASASPGAFPWAQEPEVPSTHAGCRPRRHAHRHRSSPQCRRGARRPSTR